MDGMRSQMEGVEVGRNLLSYDMDTSIYLVMYTVIHSRYQSHSCLYELHSVMAWKY